MRKRDAGQITEKQRRILEYIASFIAERGYPPSVREIGEAMGLRSPSTVHAHLQSLRSAGYLERTGHKTRALSLTGTAATVSRIPILRKAGAGAPLLTEENIEGYLPYAGAGGAGTLFALRVPDDSMAGAGILGGDLIMIRQGQDPCPGQIVAALLGEDVFCKRYSVREGKVWLLPENPYDPLIEGSTCLLLGVVVAVHREYTD